MKKSKLLTPILIGSTLVTAVPAVAMTSCSHSNGLDVKDSVTTITKKLDYKPDDGKVTVTIDKQSGLDVEFITAPTTNATTSVTVAVDENNEFTVYVKFVTAPTTKGTSTFNLNTTYKVDGTEKTQTFKDNKIDYDITSCMVEIKDGYSPKLSPATGWTKANFIQNYIDKILETKGNVYRDDLYTSCALNLKSYVDSGAVVDVTSYKICLNDIISMEGATNMFKLHMNFSVEIGKIFPNKVWSEFPEMEIDDIKADVSLECPCYWSVADADKTKSNYPVIKAMPVSGTGSISLSGKITGSFQVGTQKYSFEEKDTIAYPDPSNPQNYVSMGLTLIMFGTSVYVDPYNPEWVSPYCRNVK